MEHLAPTPMGQSVTYTARLVAVNERRVSFAVEAFDDAGLVGRGTHDRVVVDVSRFAARLRKRLAWDGPVG